MTVDGKYPERWRTSGRFSYLSSSSSFIGGSDGRENIPLLRNINNLVGCFKKVGYNRLYLLLKFCLLCNQK